MTRWAVSAGTLTTVCVCDWKSIFSHLHPDHVLADVVEDLHVLVLAPGGLSDDLLDLAHQYREYKHAKQPGEEHEHDLDVVLGVDLWVLPDADGCLGGEEKALNVGVANAIVHKFVCSNSFPC